MLRVLLIGLEYAQHLMALNGVQFCVPKVIDDSDQWWICFKLVHWLASLIFGFLP